MARRRGPSKPLSYAVRRRRGRRLARFRRWSNSPRVAGWFLVVMAALCAAGAVEAHRMSAALRDRGVRTTATVFGVYPGKRSYVVLRFHTQDGREVEADVGDYRWDPEPRLGDEPEIIYDPADPEGNVVDVRVGVDFFDMWALIAGAVLAAGLAPPTFAGKIDWEAFAGR